MSLHGSFARSIYVLLTVRAQKIGGRSYTKGHIASIEADGRHAYT